MKIAVTGATGFIGRYIVRHLVERGDTCRCWYRNESRRAGFAALNDSIEWQRGELGDERSARELIEGVDAVVHGALDRPGTHFRGGEGELLNFVHKNVLGSLRLIEAAQQAAVPRFIFISTCAVHEVILDDRKLDEAHPMWPNSHYGAYKAAVEEFVYSYGLGLGFNICALRPTGVYGVHHDPTQSKWCSLVKSVASGDVSQVTDKGGKEVHAADVAKAVGVLLRAEGIAGQAYNCYDLYISQQDVAEIAVRLSRQDVVIEKTNKGPEHQIDASKIRALGMTFGGRALLEKTVSELLNS